MSFERAKRSSQSCAVCVCARAWRTWLGGGGKGHSSSLRCAIDLRLRRASKENGRGIVTRANEWSESECERPSAGRAPRSCVLHSQPGPCRGLRRGCGCRGCKSAIGHRSAARECTGRGWRHHLSGPRAPSLVDRHRPMPSRAHDLSMHRPRAPAVHTRSRRTPPPLAHRRAHVQHCSVFAVVQSAIGRCRRRRRCGCACLRMRACVPPPRGGLNRNARRCCSLDPRARTRAHQHLCTCKGGCRKTGISFRPLSGEPHTAKGGLLGRLLLRGREAVHHVRAQESWNACSADGRRRLCYRRLRPS